MNFNELIELTYICDAHIHLAEVYKNKIEIPSYQKYSCISCAHLTQEFKIQQDLIKNSPSRIFSSFGIHPQFPLLENLFYLESLLEEKKLNAVGETGFDFYTEEFSRTKKQQTESFLLQIELAQKYNLPVIIHGRKAIEKFFLYSKQLSKIPLAIFHSFSGTYQEAVSLLNHGINAKFSFSKQILNGNKKAVQCVKQLPLEKIFFETDAPFQTLKDEQNTLPCEILKVYEQAFCLRTESFAKDNNEKFLEFCKTVSSNFFNEFQENY